LPSNCAFVSKEAQMWQNINRVVVAMCVSGTLLEPVAANAQTFPLVAPSSPTPTRTWAFPTTEAPSFFDVTTSPGVRQSRILIPVSAFTESQLRPQLRMPRAPKGPPASRSHAYRGAQRALAAFALGFVGFYVGGVTAFGLATNCECGGNETVFVGGAIGAVAGATAGLLLVR
jgi:hypothetical protein